MKKREGKEGKKKRERIATTKLDFSAVFWKLPKPADIREPGEAWSQLNYITLTHTA